MAVKVKVVAVKLHWFGNLVKNWYGFSNHLQLDCFLHLKIFALTDSRITDVKTEWQLNSPSSLPCQAGLLHSILPSVRATCYFNISRRYSWVCWCCAQQKVSHHGEQSFLHSQKDKNSICFIGSVVIVPSQPFSLTRINTLDRTNANNLEYKWKKEYAKSWTLQVYFEILACSDDLHKWFSVYVSLLLLRAIKQAYEKNLYGKFLDPLLWPPKIPDFPFFDPLGLTMGSFEGLFFFSGHFPHA